MWGVLIKCHVWSGLFREAISLYNEMLGNFAQVSSFVFPSTLRACSGIGDLGVGEMVHGRIVKCGLQFDLVIQTSLLSMYGESGCLRYARIVFEDLSVRDLVLWSSIISSHVQNGEESEGVDLFREMVVEGVEPDSVVMLSVAEACAELGLWREGKSVHGYVVRNAILSDGALDSSLITMYGKCGDLHSAEGIFNNVVHLSTATWTSMITCYNQCGCYREVIDIFSKMLLSNGEPNAVTMMGVLRSCVRLGWLKEGRSVHGFVIRKILDPEYNSLVPSLVDLYATSGDTRCAHKILFVSRETHIVSWNLLISRCIEEGSKEALTLFRKMQSYNIYPDSFTLATMLSASKAISLFDQMYSKCLEMDAVTFLSVIQACSNLGYLEKGKWIHHKLITTCLQDDTYINTALLDMYAKCGDLYMARSIFDTMSERTVVSWSAMIGGYGTHGQIDLAISLFNRMVESEVKPNEVTFMNILSACSHAGYVEVGKSYFNLMKDFGAEPQLEHYACLIDLLSRGGNLDEAYMIIDTMPFQADASNWGALLNGCRIHRRVDMIQKIQEKLLGLDMDDPGYYTLLSNVFAEGGDWGEFSMGCMETKLYICINDEQSKHPTLGILSRSPGLQLKLRLQLPMEKMEDILKTKSRIPENEPEVDGRSTIPYIDMRAEESHG
ncbi:hypothetical protein ACET3Z_029357 [Daucus carota]